MLPNLTRRMLTLMYQGNTVIVQKALGQENIDELLKLSEDYKKSKLI